MIIIAIFTAMRYYFRIILIGFALPLLFQSCSKDRSTDNQIEGIGIYDKNPFFWEYKGEPAFLIGGTKDDNLFQINDLKEHLELLASVGGNYIRCTLSSRDEGNEKPYLKDDAGFYDLEKPNPLFWNKLDSTLSYCEQLNIIAQIEIWATYDFYWGEHGWSENVFNPKLNRNYTAGSSALPEVRDLPAQSGASEFFQSVPGLSNNTLVLEYQKKFVDKLLSISLNYSNVLYSIDNETTANYQWGKFWAGYIHRKAAEAGKEIYVTEMWDSWDPSGGAVEGAIVQDTSLGGWFADYQDPHIHETANFLFTFEDTISYQFIDVANNNAQKGETHYRTAHWVRNAVLNSGKIRPINNVKIYGGDRDNIWAGSHQDGKERFWRDIFAGHASVRFHRPPSGIGLSEEAQYQIRSARKFTSSIDFFNLVPHNDLLSEREPNEAFCLAKEDLDEIAVYFPAGGSVRLDNVSGTYKLSKISISQSAQSDMEAMELPGRLENSLHEDCVIILKRSK